MYDWSNISEILKVFVHFRNIFFIVITCFNSYFIIAFPLIVYIKYVKYFDQIHAILP